MSSFARIPFVLYMSFGHFFCVCVTGYRSELECILPCCWVDCIVDSSSVLSINEHFEFNQSFLFEGKNNRPLNQTEGRERRRRRNEIGRQQVGAVNSQYSLSFSIVDFICTMHTLLIKLRFSCKM